MENASLSYLLARLPVAISMLGHGLARLPKLDKFSNWMVGQFQQSILPDELVRPFSYMLPFLELNIGLLLLVGLFMRVSLVTGSIVILVLIFGSCMLEQWENVAIQMFYGLYFAGLLFFQDKYNQYSLDYKLRGRS